MALSPRKNRFPTDIHRDCVALADERRRARLRQLTFGGAAHPTSVMKSGRCFGGLSDDEASTL